MSSEGIQKCARCSYKGASTTFPIKKNGSGYTKTCQKCISNIQAAKDPNKENSAPSNNKAVPLDSEPPLPSQPPSTVTLDQCLELISNNKNEAFELDVFVVLPEDMWRARGGGFHGFGNAVRDKIAEASDYHWNQKKTRRGAGSSVITYHCAQLEGDERKPRLHDDPKKRRGRVKMPRFNCGGSLLLTIPDGRNLPIRIRIEHDEAHPHYTDISIPSEVQELIRSMKGSTPSDIWAEILKRYGTPEYNQDQVYAHWSHINEAVWRLADDQVLSARRVLDRAAGREVEIIPLTAETGISTIAFAFKEVLDGYGSETAEIAMDSTWKTNAASYELFGFFGEANGQSLPLGFIFTTMTDGSAKPGAKERMLTETLTWLSKRCPNIEWTLSDKDPSEINACRKAINKKHQLCYWHATRYIEERLAEDKLPAAYDPRKAHAVFAFIDPTWAPGVTRGPVAEYLDGRDVEKGGDMQGGTRRELNSILQTPPPTARPPLLIMKAGDRRIPIWPSPPPLRGAGLPAFCPAAFRATIKQKYTIHFHQHPEIPFDEKGTHFTASEIHEGAVLDMYSFCREHDLAQVWAYLWNCWYSPPQWPLWARSAAPGIPRLKTTMVSEAQWKVIKHQDLATFNRPRLDLVIHVLINRLLPRVRVTLANLLGARRKTRASAPNDWQNDFRAAWLDMSKSDEQRNVERQLEVLRTSKKMKGRSERLAELEAEATRPNGKYHTDVTRWTCSCPAYLISRFLLCKHLVRTANTHIPNFNPQTNLAFFAALRRNHFPPFYNIPALQPKPLPAEDPTEETPVPVTQRKILQTLSYNIISKDTTPESVPEADEIELEDGLAREEDKGDDNEVAAEGDEEETDFDFGDEDSEVESFDGYRNARGSSVSIQRFRKFLPRALCGGSKFEKPRKFMKIQIIPNHSFRLTKDVSLPRKLVHFKKTSLG
ncbi:hypothetical protein HWV62_45332 [Athelia sp. TMB]|nr:hypothetical protein HWV62_45332 [Athelia sp. TMB]